MVLLIRILIFASLVLSAYMIVITLERCRSEKRYAFVYCVITIILYTLGYLIEVSCGNVGGGIIAIKVMYAGGCFMSPFFFLFVADYCEVRIPKKYYTIPILVIPVLFYGVVLTFDYHNLLYLNYFYDSSKAIPSLAVEPGPLYFVGALYPVLCIALTSVVLIRSIVSQTRGRRFALILLLVSCLAPLIANFVYVGLAFFFESALSGVNFTAFVMVISNFIFYYNVVRSDLFDVAPKALAITMDLIRDAFVVLDRGMAYMGSNKKAFELFPALAELSKGASILKLENWPQEILGEQISAADYARHEIEFTLPQMPGKIYSSWTNKVASDSGNVLGWVILIQDITETKSLIRSIQAQRDEIAAMRDNLKEGIFLMDRQYLIQDSYSKALQEVLSGKNLKGRSFTDLLAKSYNNKDLAIVADYFKMIVDGSVDAEMLEDINPLREFSYVSTETGEHKTLRCMFAPIDQGGGNVFVMGTIQDITAEAILKRKLAEEEARRQEEMRSLFEVLQVDLKVFEDFTEDADFEFSRMSEVLKIEEIPNRQKLVNLFQSAHAIKSNAVIIGLFSFADKLHEFETDIKKLRDENEEPGSNDILRISEELKKIIQDKDKFPEILKRLKNFCSVSGNKTDDEVFIEALKQACKRVAEDENKKAEVIVKAFDREVLSKGPRRVMKEVLTQLVRNSVCHGIEKPEKRLGLGKDETGKINLSITIENDMVHMVLGDDGSGLNYKRIAQIAKEKGLLKKGADENNELLLSNIIFNPGFSTAENENINAGRGIGLNLVKDRLREVGGSMKLKSIKGRGLVFDIQIPLNSPS